MDCLVDNTRGGAGTVGSCSLLVALVVRTAEDLYYQKNRGLYEVFRVAAWIVVSSTLLVAYVVSTYANCGVWFSLILAGLFCTMFPVALLFSLVSGPCRPRGLRWI